MTAGAMEEGLRRRLRRHAERCTARALRLYIPVLREHTRRSQPPDVVDSYVSVLRNAAERTVGDHGELLDYTQTLVELLANIGGGSQFHGKEELLDVFDRVTGDLSAAGCSTTDLRLMTARYCAAISNGGEQRRRIIEHAVRESRSADERLRALLVMAKYHIDISEYDTAHRYLNDCLALAERADTGEAQRYDINTTRGIAYFYRDRSLATRFLLDGIALDPSVTDPVVLRSTASALHHLGRIRMADGNHAAAIALIVLAQHHKDRMPMEGTQFGYYHLRLGEMLVAAGDTEAAMWHLRQAGEVFHGVRERSTAEAQLNSALAKLASARGNHDQAVHLLTKAIQAAHDDRFPRGELLFRYQLTSLHLRRGAMIAAATTALPAVRLVRVAQLGGWRWLVRQVRPPRFRPRTARPTPSTAPSLTCPCPEHDAVPVEQLLARGELT